MSACCLAFKAWSAHKIVAFCQSSLLHSRILWKDRSKVTFTPYQHVREKVVVLSKKTLRRDRIYDQKIVSVSFLGAMKLMESASIDELARSIAFQAWLDLSWVLVEGATSSSKNPVVMHGFSQIWRHARKAFELAASLRMVCDSWDKRRAAGGNRMSAVTV